MEQVLENVKQWFIDRDITQGNPEKQVLKLYEETGELSAGLLKQNEDLIKDSIGDIAVVVVGLAMMLKLDADKIFNKLKKPPRNQTINTALTNILINATEAYYSKDMICKYDITQNLELIVKHIDFIASECGYDFADCFEVAYNEIKDRKGKWINGTFVKEEDLS